jgi:hypothetical protein
MRLQISVELLIYLSVSAIVLVFVLVAVSRWSASYSNAVSRYEAYTLVSYINSAIYSGAEVSNISVSLPKDACNFSINGNKLYTRYGTFYFAEDVIAENGLFCDASGAGTIEFIKNGTDSVELKKVVK